MAVHGIAKHFVAGDAGKLSCIAPFGSLRCPGNHQDGKRSRSPSKWADSKNFGGTGGCQSAAPHAGMVWRERDCIAFNSKRASSGTGASPVRNLDSGPVGTLSIQDLICISRRTYNFSRPFGLKGRVPWYRGTRKTLWIANPCFFSTYFSCF